MRAPFFALVLATGIAHAQPAPNAAADAALTEGRRLYDVREWDKAIAKFKEAYTLRPDAAALFNLAQSYRLKGDCANASGFYKTYKRNFPEEKNIAKVDKFIVEMDACAKTQPAVVEPVTPGDPPPVVVPQNPVPVITTSPPEEPPPPPVGSDRSWMKWTGIAMAGVGAASIGLGVKFGLDGSAAKDDLAKACATSCTSAQALAIEDDGRAANKKAYIFTAVGGALVVGGVVMFVVSRMGGESQPEESSVAITPVAGGATATYSFEF
jgi:tetratricopeptide (TPR) repeat protein